MQTNLSSQFKTSTQGRLAESILRSCVHCGFCTATCPTYQLLGDELDSPRGRIYLIKQVLEGKQVTRKTQLHLDRCLTCQSCESTCPSGVKYGHLVDIGRNIVEKKVQRSLVEKAIRKLLRVVIPYPSRFRFLLTIGLVFKPILPDILKQKIPDINTSKTHENKTQALIGNQHLKRKMLIHRGCVQSVVSSSTNIATQQLLAKLGIEVVSVNADVCCGALSQHLSVEKESKLFMRKNIDAWWSMIEEENIEAIISTASGCGVMLKDYGHLLQEDAEYAKKAAKISAMVKDISEILQQEKLPELNLSQEQKNITFHSSCTLQHGQNLDGVVENILTQVGFKLNLVKDPHLCCGSAGTYSLLQPKLSQQLLVNKLENLQSQPAQVIATANVGCQMHLASKAKVPVKHWVEVLLNAYE